ncbi:hypothetical protein I7I50_02852 [Histoplasma capsulatum G186AR]|uniref:Uncharacterized protein n=1 Tax=Ajellomyces capsulatus TaxID=5037 RepID=A0A8H8D5S7_AJECA|nr:hypothetical protein I7I52_00482 [Histoplasma capsulatum]QSS71853.1 hypothetical protein I7I50_02852 [Histoplasma capsulatum G186AR]
MIRSQVFFLFLTFKHSFSGFLRLSTCTLLQVIVCHLHCSLAAIADCFVGVCKLLFIVCHRPRNRCLTTNGQLTNVINAKEGAPCLAFVLAKLSMLARSHFP